MKFVRARTESNYHVYVSLDKVDIITASKEGYPVLWIGEENWICKTKNLADSLVDAMEVGEKDGHLHP